jgi:hypothetical protein
MLLEPNSELISARPITLVRFPNNASHAIIVTMPTMRPKMVTGNMSPYPFQVMVTISHHMATGTLMTVFPVRQLSACMQVSKTLSGP